MTLGQLRAFIQANAHLSDCVEVLMENPQRWGIELIDIEIGTVRKNGHNIPVVILRELDTLILHETGR